MSGINRSLRIVSISSAWLLASSVAVGCNQGDDHICDPMLEACVYEATLSSIVVPAGSENEDLCQSWSLDNPTELWVRTVTQSNDGGYHHANWFFVPDDQFALPDGTWACSEQNFSELGAALLGGFLFAMSTQSHLESQSYPAGGAVRIPPYSRVIGASHLLNAGDQDVNSDMRLRLETVPPDEVQAKLVPGRIQYHDLALDPESKSSFATDCLIDETYQTTMGKPLQYELYYALSHYHALGTYAQLELIGGPRDGEVLFRNEGYDENFGFAFEQPLDLAASGASGLRFTCGFDNPRADTVGWGIGDQEMCVLAVMARTDMAWDGDVAHGAGELIGVAADGEVQYQGPCSMFGVPWDHDKAGGPPR